MHEILPFPKDKSRRVAQLKKSEAQRFLLTLSLFSFILIAVVSNEQVMRNQRPMYLVSDNSNFGIDRVNRSIASADPVNLFRDVEWEHELAKRLSDQNLRKPASIAHNLTPLDEFRYGPLAGRYHIVSNSNNADDPNSLVAELNYIDSDDITGRPVQVSDSAEFLVKYRNLLSVKFESVRLDKKSSEGQEVWSLFSDNEQVVGQAVMEFEGSGRYLKRMKVQTSPAIN